MQILLSVSIFRAMPEANSGCLSFLTLIFGPPSPKQTAGGAQEILSKGQLLSRAEMNFFQALEEANEGRFKICLKVRAADLFRPIKSKALLNTVSQKHADFVLCDWLTMTPVLVIELDDKSHASQRAKIADEVKDNALRQAGIKLLRIQAQRSYDLAAIRSAFPPA